MEFVFNPELLVETPSTNPWVGTEPEIPFAPGFALKEPLEHVRQLPITAAPAKEPPLHKP